MKKTNTEDPDTLEVGAPSPGMRLSEFQSILAGMTDEDKRRVIQRLQGLVGRAKSATGPLSSP